MIRGGGKGMFAFSPDCPQCEAYSSYKHFSLKRRKTSCTGSSWQLLGRSEISASRMIRMSSGLIPLHLGHYEVVKSDSIWEVVPRHEKEHGGKQYEDARQCDYWHHDGDTTHTSE
mmetsp:Transcript_143517/g.250269  ORF Transcript_143517/g.250269 Transcript_143517/m.250269 type:complete len:115 (-) Transcript_143517:1856-2200(-)